MAFQRKLKVGDIITIAGKELLVIRSEHVVSPAYDGDYWVDEIDCIKFNIAGGTLEYEDPKVHQFYFEGGCMTGLGKLIKDSDVKVIGTGKLTTEVVTTYVIKNVKFYK